MYRVWDEAAFMLHEAVHEVTTVLQTVKICATIADSTYVLENNSNI
jgi:hypothetical protein